MERLLNPVLVLLLLLVALLSLTIGTLDLEVSSALANWFSNLLTGEVLTREALIVGEIRLPRTLLALVVGAAMGMSGAALQGLLRNPLVDPGLIGASQGAALGAALQAAARSAAEVGQPGRDRPSSAYLRPKQLPASSSA